MKCRRGKWRWKHRRCSGQLLVCFSNRHWVRRMDMKIEAFLFLSFSREVIKVLVGIFISGVWRDMTQEGCVSRSQHCPGFCWARYREQSTPLVTQQHGRGAWICWKGSWDSSDPFESRWFISVFQILLSESKSKLSQMKKILQALGGHLQRS